MPVFLAALLVVRGVPALFFVPTFGLRRAVAAGLLQATSLPFVVAATQVGVELGELSPVTAAAMVSAGLLSVLIFPTLALGLLREPRRDTEAAAEGSGSVRPHEPDVSRNA